MQPQPNALSIQANAKKTLAKPGPNALFMAIPFQIVFTARADAVQIDMQKVK